jgi:hypothetical protein
LQRALGTKAKPAPAPLRLRLVFEVAAAVSVAVFIGYFFIGGDRFWQTPEKQTPSDMMKENASPPAYGTIDRLEEPVPPAVLPGELTEGDHMADDSRPRKKESRTNVSKDLPAVAGQSISTGQDKGALPQSALPMPQPAAEVQSMPEQERQRVESKSKAIDPARLDAAAGSRPTAQTLGVGAAQAQQEKRSQEQTADASPQAGSGRKTKEAQARDEIAAQAVPLPIRIEGDVSWSNLQNPERIASWSWFPKDLVLELEIDQAGTVTAVAVSKTADKALAAQAAQEAGKLVFAISEKRTRRARLAAKDAPPN